MIFNKESFVQLVNALREQYDKDCAYAHKMGDLLNSAEIPPYDWDVVHRFLVSQIQKQFPPSKDGHCEFERYCFELNFGRDLDGKVNYSAEELWLLMNGAEAKKIVSTHPLIDDSEVNNIKVNDAEVLSPSKNK